MRFRFSQRLVGRGATTTFQQRLAAAAGSSSSQLDIAATTSWIPFESEHSQNPLPIHTRLHDQQVRHYVKWAPPAYIRQRDRRRKALRAKDPRDSHKKSKNSSRLSSNDKRRSRSRNRRQVDSISMEQQQDIERVAGLFQGQKLFRLQGNLLELLQTYSATVTDAHDTEEEKDDKEVISSPFLQDQSDDAMDMVDEEDLWNQTRLILDTLDAWEDMHNNNSHHGSTRHVEETQQTYQEIGRLMRRVIHMWCKQPPDLLLGHHGMDAYNNQEKTRNMDSSDDEKVVYVGVDKSLDEQPPLASQDVAEKLLLGLAKMQSIRTRFASNLKEDRKTQETTDTLYTETSTSWKEWLYDIFVFSKGDSSEQDNVKDDASQQHDDKAQEEDSLSPTTTVTPSLLRNVLQAIVRGSNMSNGDHDATFDTDAVDQYYLHWKTHFDEKNRSTLWQAVVQKEELANRLTMLAETCARECNIELDLQILNLLVKAHTQVGYISHVVGAERLCKGHSYRHKKSTSLFHSILRGYRLASSWEASGRKRADAAKKAEWLLQIQQREANKRKVAGGGGSIPLSTIVSYKLVMQSLANPGVHFLPDMVNRAETLMELLLGKEEFRELVNGDFKQTHDTSLTDIAGVLHYLILIYTRSRKRNNLQQAKRLLEYMETNGQQQQTLKDHKKNADTTVAFPNVWTYNSVLSGILQLTTLKLDPDERLENALYGSSLLDSMEQRSLSPDRESLDRVLQLWSYCRSPQADDRALGLLSRLHLNCAASGNEQPVEQPSYTAALHCLSNAASVGKPGAARRASQLISKMQAQCPPIYTSKATQKLDTGKEPLDARPPANTMNYNDALHPTLMDYHAVLRSCRSTCYPPDRHGALEIAFETYNFMVERGVSPPPHTYRLLLHCCSNLLPDDKERCKELSRLVFQSARDQDLDDRYLARTLRRENEDLYHEFYNENRSGDSSPQSIMDAGSIGEVEESMAEDVEVADGDKLEKQRIE